MFAQLNALVEPVAGGDGFRGVGYCFQGLVLGIVWGREEPVRDAGEGFLFSEGWPRMGLKDQRKWWGRDERVLVRGGRCDFFVDRF